MTASFRPKKRFRFELFWLKLDGFDAAVTKRWRCDPNITDPFARLDACFRNLATFLQSWGDRRVGNLKLQIAMANLVIHRLEAAQDTRLLSDEEHWLGEKSYETGSITSGR
jgi:hypothetical protein